MGIYLRPAVLALFIGTAGGSVTPQHGGRAVGRPSHTAQPGGGSGRALSAARRPIVASIGEAGERRVRWERRRVEGTAPPPPLAPPAAFARCVVPAADSASIDCGGSRARRPGRPIGGGRRGPCQPVARPAEARGASQRCPLCAAAVPAVCRR